MPTKSKVMVINAIIQAVATYGGELFGMSATRCKPIQQVVDAATRTLAKCGKSAAMVRLRQELSLTDLNIKTAVARTRTFGQWSSLKTWISDPTRRYAKSGFIEIDSLKNAPSEKPLLLLWVLESNPYMPFKYTFITAPETIEHMLLKSQYINIYKAQVATKPSLLLASISMRLVDKLLGKKLKLSSTRICKDPTVLCVKNTLATAKFLNAIALPRYLMLKTTDILAI
ncbi:hypothetical protein BB561_005293 [Smittium simulii]|uniref:Uncharacterized protein n=1 Tax=Smittium simulii TaxID=133385 RepID=A0A2T9YB18_9FUNG|nr:hypothetical protein BB561_005293 [Smittium simulii]